MKLCGKLCGEGAGVALDHLQPLVGVGAGDEIRTHDPNLGKVVLYP